MSARFEYNVKISHIHNYIHAKFRPNRTIFSFCRKTFHVMHKKSRRNLEHGFNNLCLRRESLYTLNNTYKNIYGVMSQSIFARSC